MQIKFLGTANTAQAKAQFAALTAQVEALNSAIAKTAMMPSGGSPAGFQRTAGAVNAANRAFNSALASSGAYRVEQLKINDAVEKNTTLLKQQKLTMHEVFSKQGRKNMHEVYKNQLRMNNAQAQMIRGGVGDGKTRMTLAVPTHVDESWDTLNQRVGMFGHQLASASKQTVNWGKNMQWAGRQLMVGFTLPVMAFGAAAGVMAFQVDKQLTRIAKVYDTTANANSNSLKEQMSVEKELNSLREAGMKTATDAAHAYGVSITDTLSVQAELAATGQKGAELQANTTDIVRIATLGEIDHAVATKALIALQSTLGLSTKETADAFNYMNSVENATSLSTADFAEAIPRALAPMKEMGGSLKDLSILMVAMKERGIEAGEGANAIKAMMQRVYRPSKQVREEWQQLAGVDLEQIVQSSGGKVMEILPKIAEAIDGMARPEKVKLLAGYFGTYQVTRMSAMLAGISDMNKGIGQTSRVLDVNQQSWQEWSKTADRELKAIQESASGKFKRALEGVKAELAAIGDPFLAVASGFLTAVTKVAAFFNSMPDWVKKGVVFAAILGALIGPVVMLVGLFANFAGNIGLFAATMLKATSSFNLFGKAEWAARKEAELARAGFINQASAAEKLKQRIDAVTLALQEQARIMAAVGKVPLPASLQTPVAVRPGMIPSANMPNNPSYNGVPIGPQASTMAALGAQMGLRGKEWTRPDYAAGEKKPRKVRNDGSAAAAIRATQHEQMKLNQQAQAETKIRQRTAGLITTTGVATAAMSASMLLMLTTSGETSGEFAKWLMILSIALPLMQGAVPAAKAIALWTAATAKTAKTAALAQVAAAGGTMKIAGGLGVARGAAVGLKAAMLGLMGPIGWTVTAVAAIGYAFYKVNQNAKEAYEAQVKSQKTLDDAAKNWADTMGTVAGQYKRIELSAASIIADSPKAFDAAVTYYEDDEKGSQVAKDFQDADNQDLEALQMFVDLQVRAGLTAKQAATNIAALYSTTGISLADANAKGEQYYETIGDIATADWSAVLQNQSALIEAGMDEFISSSGRTDDIVKQNAEVYGQMFNQAFANADTPQAARKVFSEIKGQALSEWNPLFDSLRSDPVKAQALLDNNIKSAQDLADWYRSLGNDAMPGMSEMFNLDPANTQAMIYQFDTAKQLEGTIIGLAAEYMGLGDDILAVTALQEEMNVAARMMSYKDAVKSAQGLVTEYYAMGVAAAIAKKNIEDSPLGNTLIGDAAVGVLGDTNEELYLASINAYNVANGFKEGKSPAEALHNLVNKIKVAAGGAAGAVSNIASAMSSAYDFGKADLVSMTRDGIEGVRSDMVDMANDTFDAAMNASIDGAQEGWDTKISNAEDAQEKTQDRFDARWDRRKKTVEKYWDARINKIDKAMEAEQKSEELRQRIFEAEQTRIDRMAESANRTIDFNIALQTGDLDEAAKLRNDMEATAAEWALGDGAEAGSRKSDARLDKMDKQKSSLETMRDNEMEALDKREDAERKHLDKIQEMHMDNLNAQSEANMDYLRKDWDQQKKAYDDKLELFESLPAANQKQLLKALTAAGLSLDDFGLNTLNPKANQWGGFFETSLKKHIKKAGNEIAQDNMWELLGKRSTKELLFGMGFGGMAAFKKFMADGVLPDDFGKPKRPNPGAKGGGAPTRPQDTGHGPLSQHTGGWAGEGGNRKGVARTQKGLHQNEVMIRAQKEEFIVNKTAAKMHGGLLENINSGRFRDTVSNKGGGVGGASGIVGLMAGAMNVGFAKGVAKALSNAYNARKAGAGTKSAGPLGSAVGLGKGYLPGSGGWALPSVPGKGWRNTHDYANGEGSPLFAYNDGVVVDSKATVSGGTVGNGNYATPYRSYGETIAIRGVDGRTVRYAHLMPGGRYVKSGQQVKGGALIGRSGNTGNSTGPHTHFDINGDYNASNWFAKNGIGLKSGGVTKTDGMANLHKDEVVVDPKRTKTIYQGIDDMQGVWTWLSGMKTKKMLSERNSGKNTTDLSDSGSDSDVATGTYNVLFATSNKATKGDLSDLMTKADVLSLTEMSGSKNNLHDWFGQKGWGRVGDGDAEVIWNNKKYEALKTGNRQLNSITGSTPASKKRTASYALLKDRETGRQFWQVAAHTLGQLKAGPNGDAIRNQQWENLNKLYNELSKSAPVFLGGDLNTDLRRGNIPIGNTKSNWAGNMGGSNYTIKRSFFDHVLYGPMAQLMGQQVVGGLSSDHNALLTQFNIPGLSKGAENIRWDNTMANLHKGEAVLTKDISEKFRRGVDNFASGGNNEYTIKVTVMNPQADPDEIAGAVMTAIERKESRKPTRRRR